jgi:hypothetical protein
MFLHVVLAMREDPLACLIKASGIVNYLPTIGSQYVRKIVDPDF